MREAMGVLQHHDAVTGTAKQAVTNDYAWRLSRGIDECEDVIRSGYDVLFTGSHETKAPPQVFCHLSNITECAFTEQAKDNYVVTLYNPLARPVSKYVRLPVAVHTAGALKVRAPNNEVVVSQLVPVPKEVLTIPGRRSAASHELVFRADLPPMGFKSFYVEKVAKWEAAQLSTVTRGRKRMIISNDLVAISTDKAGRVKSIATGGQVVELGVALGYYEGHKGHNKVFNDRASGAYIFRPTKQTPTILDFTKASKIQGPLVEEIHLSCSGGFASMVIRLYEGSPDIEVEWLVGPIPVSDGVGKEVIAKYGVPLKSEGVFYTDSNGRQMVERKRDHRPTWNLNVTEPVSGNYYPVNSRISIADKHDATRLTVLTDRSQGGSSMEDGEVELMLHRRLLFDDAFGVGEALNESAFGQGLAARGKHWLQLALDGKEAERRHRFAAQQKFMDAVTTFSSAGGLSFEQWSKKYRMYGSALNDKAKLPANVHLLSAEEWHGNSRDSVLLRFEHIFQTGEDEVMSKSVQFDLDAVFAGFEVTAVEEVALAANLRLGERKRLDWNPKEDNEVTDEEEAEREPLNVSGKGPKMVELTPMQIRTFIVDLEPRQKLA